MDFAFDRIATGRTMKCLVIVDDATHESVAIPPEHTIGGDHLIAGNPNQNAYDESFIGRFRDECLNEHWFTSLERARAIIET